MSINIDIENYFVFVKTKECCFLLSQISYLEATLVRETKKNVAIFKKIDSGDKKLTVKMSLT